MPKANGKNLSYEDQETCIADAKRQGVSAGPCMGLPTKAMKGYVKDEAHKVTDEFLENMEAQDYLQNAGVGSFRELDMVNQQIDNPMPGNPMQGNPKPKKGSPRKQRPAKAGSRY